MKKFDDYEFQIEWIENIESITEDDKKRLYELRTLNKRRKTHLNYLKKNQKIYDECKRREKLKDSFSKFHFLSILISAKLNAFSLTSPKRS